MQENYKQKNDAHNLNEPKLIQSSNLVIKWNRPCLYIFKCHHGDL